MYVPRMYVGMRLSLVYNTVVVMGMVAFATNPSGQPRGRYGREKGGEERGQDTVGSPSRDQPACRILCMQVGRVVQFWQRPSA